jgi:hypothetical protein
MHNDPFENRQQTQGECSYHTPIRVVLSTKKLGIFVEHSVHRILFMDKLSHRTCFVIATSWKSLKNIESYMILFCFITILKEWTESSEPLLYRKYIVTGSLEKKGNGDLSNKSCHLLPPFLSNKHTVVLHYTVEWLCVAENLGGGLRTNLRKHNIFVLSKDSASGCTTIDTL